MLRIFAFKILPRDDVHQVIAMAKITGEKESALLDRLARDLGWLKPRINGAPRWVTEEQYLMLVHKGVSAGNGYRHGSLGKRAAAMKMSKEARLARSRKALAAKAAKAAKKLMEVNKNEI